MKKIVLLVIALTFVMAFSGCGKDTSEKSDKGESKKSISDKSSDKEDDDEEDDEQPDEDDGLRKVGKKIDNSEKPEVTQVEISGKYEGELRGTVSIDDVYNVNILHSGVVGLVGAPFEISYDETMEDTRLTFYYNKDELRGVPEKNLLFLKYNESECYYEEIFDFELDTENSAISIPITESGVYMLVDAYEWLKVWGWSESELSQYAYNSTPEKYMSDWERECDTGSIMDIADVDWAVENASYFYVYTPEQLAGVVYYVNAISDGYSNTYITLMDDIDLAGYDWVPMGWGGSSGNGFSGTIDGQGHTISNLTINTEYWGNTGLVGYGNGLTIRNLNVENAKISGGSRTGILGGEVYGDVELTNVNVSGEITDAYGEVGSMVGREVDIYSDNCTADVTVNGEKYEYFTQRLKTIAETEVVETFTLTLDDDYCITRDEVEYEDSLTWHIEFNGRTVLERGATNELVLDTHKWVGSDYGTYTIWLEQFINGTYIRTSNIIEYKFTYDVNPDNKDVSEQSAPHTITKTE